MATPFLFFIIFCCTILFCYSWIILFFYRGWRKTNPYVFSQINCYTKVSVVIAARNEAENIENILSDLCLQSYPTALFEIVLVDDGSSDETKIIAEKFIPKLPIQILSNDFNGKKNAIYNAIKIAKGELIITTDADCRVSPQWIESIASYYQIHHPSMIIAPVVISYSTGLFEAFQALEFSSLVASGAGAAGQQHPIMCNAANMAFAKKDFLSFNDPMHSFIPSGDDVMLMLSLKKKNKEIHFLKSITALVTTKAEESFSAFFQQRIRWTSKSKYYKDADTICVAIIVLLINGLIVVSAFAALFHYQYGIISIGIVIIKSGVDCLLLNSFNRFTNQNKLMKWFIPIQIIYPFYILFTGIAGNVFSFRWKGRRY